MILPWHSPISNWQAECPKFVGRPPLVLIAQWCVKFKFTVNLKRLSQRLVLSCDDDGDGDDDDTRGKWGIVGVCGEEGQWRGEKRREWREGRVEWSGVEWGGSSSSSSEQ